MNCNHNFKQNKTEIKSQTINNNKSDKENIDSGENLKDRSNFESNFKSEINIESSTKSYSTREIQQIIDFLVDDPKWWDYFSNPPANIELKTETPESKHGFSSTHKVHKAENLSSTPKNTTNQPKPNEMQNKIIQNNCEKMSNIKICEFQPQLKRTRIKPPGRKTNMTILNNVDGFYKTFSKSGSVTFSSDSLSASFSSTDLSSERIDSIKNNTFNAKMNNIEQNFKINKNILTKNNVKHVKKNNCQTNLKEQFIFKSFTLTNQSQSTDSQNKKRRDPADDAYKTRLRLLSNRKANIFKRQAKSKVSFKKQLNNYLKNILIFALISKKYKCKAFSNSIDNRLLSLNRFHKSFNHYSKRIKRKLEFYLLKEFRHFRRVHLKLIDDLKTLTTSKVSKQERVIFVKKNQSCLINSSRSMPNYFKYFLKNHNNMRLKKAENVHAFVSNDKLTRNISLMSENSKMNKFQSYLCAHLIPKLLIPLITLL
jgi:hypothetical protein